MKSNWGKASVFLIMILLVIALFSGLSVNAASEGDFVYNDNGDGITVTITGYTGTEKLLTIPETLGGKPVTSIGDRAFQGKQLESVIIPGGVTIIGSYAFYLNNLTSATIPSSVKIIGSYSFYFNKLTSVTIPSSVKSIERNAFYGNELESVIILDGVTTIGLDAFGANKIISLTVPNSVSTIGEGAFSSNRLTSVTIPTNVTIIGQGTFRGNKLESVIIPTGVTTINYGAFESNPLKTVIFEGAPTTINPTAFDPANTKFQGWFTDKNYSNAWNKLVLGPMTIHAKYTYTVSFNTNGGTAVASQDIASYGKVKEPEVPTMAGHTFVAWYKDELLKDRWDFANDEVTGDTTLYAKWEAILNTTHKLTFVTNGGTAVASQDIASYGKVKEPEVPTMTGHTFVAWYKDELLKDRWDFANDEVTGDTTLYAKWKKNQSFGGSGGGWSASTYTLTFNSNGGTMVDMQTITYGEKVKIPVPTRAGYTFGGWYKEAELKNKWNFFTDVLTENTTLYAKWIDTNSACANQSKRLPFQWSKQMMDSISIDCTKTSLFDRYLRLFNK